MKWLAKRISGLRVVFDRIEEPIYISMLSGSSRSQVMSVWVASTR